MDFLPEVEKAAEQIEQISEASEEQKRFIESINGSLKGFFKNSNKNTEISGEIFAISSKLQKLSKVLKEKVNSLDL